MLVKRTMLFDQSSLVTKMKRRVHNFGEKKNTYKILTYTNIRLLDSGKLTVYIEKAPCHAPN